MQKKRNYPPLSNYEVGAAMGHFWDCLILYGMGLGMVLLSQQEPLEKIADSLFFMGRLSQLSALVFLGMSVWNTLIPLIKKVKRAVAREAEK